MERDYWQARWRENKIAFHEAKPHPFLVNHIDDLNISAGSTVFVPLCGKTVDIDWLLAEGYRVVGIEFNSAAVDEVFERLGETPTVSMEGSLGRRSCEQLTIYIGDIFALDQSELGPVGAVFDRGALVALPPDIRARYAPHLAAISGRAPQLLIHYDYDQSQTEGPPFSVPHDAVRDLYDPTHALLALGRRPIEGPLAERCSGEELVSLLPPF